LPSQQFHNPGMAQSKPLHDEVVCGLDHLAVGAAEQVEGRRDAPDHVQIVNHVQTSEADNPLPTCLRQIVARHYVSTLYQVFDPKDQCYPHALTSTVTCASDGFAVVNDLL